MVSSSKELRIRYTADTSGVKRGVGEIERLNATLGSKLKSAGAAMTSVGKTATLGLTLPLVAFGKTAIDSFGEASRVAAQTDAVLKSTGGAAGVTAGEVDRLSQKIGELAAVDNDAVQAGANMLLTFTNIRNEAGRGNDVFDQTLKVTQDVAAAMGTDTKTAALQLGKALNDPAAGVSKLTRIGVTFTEQQKKQIAALAEAGDAAGAQQIILAELSKEFGGSAKAAGATATPFQKFSLAMDDLGESVGAILAPMLEKVADVAGRLAAWFQQLSPGAKDLAVKIALVAAAVGPVLIIVGKLTTAIGSIISVAGKIGLLANPWFLIAAAVAVVVVLIIRNWDKVKRYVMPIVEAIKRFAIDSWNAIASAAEAVWRVIGGAVKAAWAVIKAVIGAYLAYTKTVFNIARAVAVGAWKVISGAVKAAWAVIKAVIGAYLAYVKVVFAIVKTVAVAAWRVISGAVKAAWAVIKAVVAVGKAIVLGAWTAIRTAAVAAWQGVKSAVGNAWSGIKSIGNTMRSFFVGVWRGVKDAAVTVWRTIKSVATGVWNTISSGFRTVFNGIARAWNSSVGRLSFSFPDWVPGLGGKGFDVPNIPYLAKGGRVLAGGLAIVGERGPELLSLPGGAAVSPLTARSSSASTDVHVYLDRRRFGRGLELELLTTGR